MEADTALDYEPVRLHNRDGGEVLLPAGTVPSYVEAFPGAFAVPESLQHRWLTRVVLAGPGFVLTVEVVETPSEVFAAFREGLARRAPSRPSITPFPGKEEPP